MNNTSAAAHKDLLTAISDENANDPDFSIAFFEKWHKECAEGFYIRDLDTVVELLDVMIDKGYIYIHIIIELLLDVCAKPLMELKANERLSARGVERIERYFAKLACLWTLSSSAYKIKLGKCFRCIANGGRDPTVLRADHVEWVPDGQRLKVTDKKFVQQRLRESEALDVLVREFMLAAELLNYKLSSTDEPAAPAVAAGTQSEDPSVVIPPPVSPYDDLEQYGVPRNFGKPSRPGVSDEASLAEESTTDMSIEESLDSSPRMLINTLPAVLSRNNSVRGSSNDLLREKEQVSPAITRDLSQVMLDLCLELSADPDNASVMCSLGICDGAIVLIDKDARFDPRENRISFTIELLWNALEHFLEKARTDNPSEADDCSRHYLVKHERMVDLGRAVEVLKGVLNYRLHEGYRLSDKELRNEVLIVLTLLAEFPSAIGCIMRCEMLTLLITYACVEEQGVASWPFFTKNIAKRRNFATASDIDLEFKKALWFIVSACLRTNDPDALLCFASSPLLASMLQYLDHDYLDPHATHHSHNTNQHGGLGDSAGELQQLTFSVTSLMLHDESQQHQTGAGASKSFVEEKQQHDVQSSSRRKQTGTALLGSSSTGHLPFKAKDSFIATLPLSKLRELQLLAVTFLVHNAPKVLGEFERLDGALRVIALTLKYCSSEVPEHKSLIFHSLILLNRCLINSLSVRRFMKRPT